MSSTKTLAVLALNLLVAVSAYYTGSRGLLRNTGRAHGSVRGAHKGQQQSRRAEVSLVVNASRHGDLRDDVKLRMSYWKGAEQPAGEALKPVNDRYLFFDYDHGGLNNIRIGWEMAAVAAQASGRTLVYPPKDYLYLLGGEPSGFEYFLDMPRVKTGLPVMSLAEFVQKEGENLGIPESVRKWAKSNPDNQPGDEWNEWRQANMKSSGKEDLTVCNMESYLVEDKMVYTSPSTGARIFSCGNWPNVGEPRFRQGSIGTYGPAWNAPTEAFSMLRNHFIWHPDVFDIAGRVVQNLGLFKYVAVHARYGDFQFQNHRRPQDTLLKDGWLSLKQESASVEHHKQQRPRSARGSAFLEVDASAQQKAMVASARARKLMRIVRGWVNSDGTGKVYIATDETSPNFKQPFVDAKLSVVQWQDLLREGEAGTGPLADVMKLYPRARLDNLAGPIEQVICTFGKVFIGSEKSTFSGYIERMRLYAQAPTHATYIKYAGIDASDIGDRMFHDRAVDRNIESRVHSMLETWEANQGAVNINRDDPGLLPLDAA
eukprot:TRINITY_DN62889_c0_g1_i1.p1 TRINITY_DN62889_c0_g1~~TRINITY_DN62889_c0_g1_i1.p1  ORF type:complete len:543 (+),score=107.30 TRINITY_DN62889_c0_g1_i1:166-1794(+)